MPPRGSTAAVGGGALAAFNPGPPWRPAVGRTRALSAAASPKGASPAGGALTIPLPVDIRHFMCLKYVGRMRRITARGGVYFLPCFAERLLHSCIILLDNAINRFRDVEN